MKNSRVTKLFEIKYPIVQGGMIWCAPWELAAAVSNAGGLGLIGSGSMQPDVLRHHIRRCRENTDKPFGVNIPLMYPHADQHIQILIEEKVPLAFTSAGNPAKWTSTLKSQGIRVAHVVSSARFARKAEDAGVDAVVAEGFEAGGHNGREETTTLCLVPQVRNAVDIPVIAAGGIGSGRAMLAAFAMGAEGVQIGSLFAACEESSAHKLFKQAIVNTEEGQTHLVLKQLSPVRLIENEFYRKVADAEVRGATDEELSALLGKGRAKKGMFDGDLLEGELEIGQVSAQIGEISSAAEVIKRLMEEYRDALRDFREGKWDADD